MGSFNGSLRASAINFGDDFDNLSEVVRLFAPAESKVLSRRHVHIPGRHGELAWILRDSDVDDGLVRIEYGPVLDAKGWREINSVAVVEQAARRLSKGVRSGRRLLFKEEVREGAAWLKFYGVFELDFDAGTSEESHELVFRRVARTASCAAHAESAVRPVLPIGQLAGARLEAVLLDRVALTTDASKDVRVWPGSILRVDRADAVSGQLVCSADGMSAPVSIPLRDIELGYFNVLPVDASGGSTKWIETLALAHRPPKAKSRSHRSANKA